MKPSRAWPLIGALLLGGATVCAAGEIRLEGGGSLTVTEIPRSRALPHAFYDQAMASLPRLYPDHVLLAGRRSGAIGEVLYALVCFRESRDSDTVLIQAAAVHEKRAWDLEAVAPASYGDTLLRVLELIGRLPKETQ